MPATYAPKKIFLLALSLLILSALSASLMMYRMYRTETLVRHTYDVLLQIDATTSDLAKAGRYRMAFLENGDSSFADEFASTRSRVYSEIATLRELVSDSPKQLANCDRLEAAASTRLDILEKSIERKRAGFAQPLEQAAATSEVVRASFETATIAGQMETVEESLLQKRSTLTSKLFLTMLAILLLTFSLSIFLLTVYYRILGRELKRRSQAEENAQRLSVLVMTMQDEERRKFARELHDSLGQNLTAAKILADQLIRKHPDEKSLAELQSIVAETLKETRTISHLLHPPLLDEMGFATAARWFIEGYSKRTGIAVSVEIPDEPIRLPRILELTLFRVLQESLTNIHRHSGSNRAEVNYLVQADKIILRVCDFGVGIPSRTLRTFMADGSSVGIGLAGMRERVREQGGSLDVISSGEGTTVSVRFSWAEAAASVETDQSPISRASAVESV